MTAGSLRDAVSKTEHDRLTDARLEHCRPAASQTGDQVEYIADLLLELKEMAGGHGFATLAGILDLAHAEARVQAEAHVAPVSRVSARRVDGHGG